MGIKIKHYLCYTIVVVAFCCCFGFWLADSLTRVNVVRQNSIYLNNNNYSRIKELQSAVHAKLSQEDELILYGSSNAKYRHRDFATLHKKFPSNKTYFAHSLYLLPFFSYESVFDGCKNTKLKESYADLQETYLKLLGALNRAEKLEPDNAFYNYCKAQLYFNANFIMRDDKPHRKLKLISDYGKNSKQSPYFLPLDDDSLLFRSSIFNAVVEYQCGLKKAYHRAPLDCSRNFDFNMLLTVDSWGNMSVAEKLGLVTAPKKELNCLFLVNTLQYDFFEKMLELFAVGIVNRNFNAFPYEAEENFRNSRTLEELRVLLAENIATSSRSSKYYGILYMGEGCYNYTHLRGVRSSRYNYGDNIEAQFSSLQSDALSMVHKIKNKDLDSLLIKLLPKVKILTEIDYQCYIDDTNFYTEVNCGKGVQDSFELLTKGQQLDPDNSLYDYYQSLLLLRSAVIDARYRNIPAFDELYYKNDQCFILKDRNKLTMAFKSFEKGLTKKFYNAYDYELLQKQMDILRKNRSYDDFTYYNALYGLRSKFPLQSYAKQRQISNMVIFYAKVLYYEGRIAEANRVLDTLPIYIKQLNQNTIFGVGLSVNMHILKSYYKTKLSLVKKEGDVKKVKCFKKQFAEITKMSRRKRSSVPLADIKKYGAIWTKRCIWVSKSQFLKKANNERLLEFSFLAKILSPVILFIILIVLFVKSQLILFAEEMSCKNVTAVKLKIRDVALVGLFGIVLPGAVYFCIATRFEYLFQYKISEVVFQSIFLIISIVVPLSVVLTIITASRAKKLNVKVPRLRYYYIKAIVLYSLAVVFSCLLIVSENGTGEYIVCCKYDLYIFSGIILLYVFCEQLIKLIKIFVGEKIFCEWRVLRSRKLLLWVFISSILVMVANSWVFSQREYYYISHEDCIFSDAVEPDIAVQIMKKKLNDDFLSNY